MALVLALVKPSFEEEVKSSSSSSLTVRDEESVNVFFRLVNNKNVTLAVNPDTEIKTVKKNLVQKLAFMEAASSQKQPVAPTATGLTALVAFFLLAAAARLQPKLRWNDLVFIYNGKPLDDDGCLADYRHHNNDVVVHVSMRLHGGCFMVSATVFCMLCTAVIGSTCTCGLSLVAVPFLLPLLFVLPLFCL